MQKSENSAELAARSAIAMEHSQRDSTGTPAMSSAAVESRPSVDSQRSVRSATLSPDSPYHHHLGQFGTSHTSPPTGLTLSRESAGPPRVIPWLAPLTASIALKYITDNMAHLWLFNQAHHQGLARTRTRIRPLLSDRRRMTGGEAVQPVR